MDKEIEATFIKADHAAMRLVLEKVGAKQIYSERLFRRYIFAPHNEEEIHGTWIRVRDEGDKVTMSVKRVSGAKIEDQSEVCLTVNSFDDGYEFLKQLGLKQKAYQETKRELWKIGDVEITLDTWPGISPIIEIEGPSEELVRKAAEQLELDYNEAVFGAVDLIYEMEAGITQDQINNQTLEIKFEKPPKKEDYS
jgi:adenylate cyclase, class 2